MTDEELGRAEAERLGVEPCRSRDGETYEWADRQDSLGYPSKSAILPLSIWKCLRPFYAHSESAIYARLGQAIREMRAACGYDDALARQAATIAELHGKLAFLKSKGLTVGKLKDQNGENWSYAIEHHSELCDLKTMDKLMDAEKKCDELRERAEKAEAERDELLASHQKVVGQHNGLVLDRFASNFKRCL